MKKTRFATSLTGTFKALSREQLKKVLGGDQCCICNYPDGTDVTNDCDDSDDLSGCCGPAAKSATCMNIECSS